MPAEPMHPEDLRRKELDEDIPTHLPGVKPGDEKKIVGEDQVVHVKDYNAPPPEGARKSTGDALDPVGGPGLGMPPLAQGSAAAQRSHDTKVEGEVGPQGPDDAGD